MEMVVEKFEQRSLFRAMEMLKRKAHMTKLWTEGMERKFNSLDDAATNIMLACEKRCIPASFGKHPWSAKLAEKGLMMRYINLVFLHTAKGNIPQQVLEHARHKAKSENILSNSEEELKEIRSVVK